jgi:hypothetical protein
MMTREALQRCVAIHHRRPQDTYLPTWKATDGVIHDWIDVEHGSK